MYRTSADIFSATTSIYHRLGLANKRNKVSTSRGINVKCLQSKVHRVLIYFNIQLTKTNQMLLNVIELLEETIDYLKEGTFYALEHSGNLEETIKSFFPQEAIESFKKARELYPQLPKFKRPEPPWVIIFDMDSCVAKTMLTSIAQSNGHT